MITFTFVMQEMVFSGSYLQDPHDTRSSEGLYVTVLHQVSTHTTTPAGERIVMVVVVVARWWW